MYVPRLGSWGMKNTAPGARLAAAPRWRRLNALAQAPDDVVRFDPSLPYTDRPSVPGAPAGGFVLNQGCPPAYFAQLVGAGEPGAIGPISIPGVVSGGYVRCRLGATTTPGTIMEETGITWDEAVDVYTQAARDTAHQVGGALEQARDVLEQALSWTPWIIGGAAVIVGGIVLLRVLR